MIFAFGLFVFALAAESLLASTQTDQQIWVSRSGHFHLSYESELDPIIINRMHSWVLHLVTADGQAVSAVKITMQGGMPEHDHGLPTRPRVSASADPGRYLVEGIRFHMSGHWEIEFTISTGRDEDTVLIPLEL